MSLLFFKTARESQLAADSSNFTAGWLGPLFDIEDSERDARSPMEWLDSVSAYLAWRAGCSWRRLHRPGQRYNAQRWYYLDGLRLLESVRYAPEKSNRTNAQAVAGRGDLLALPCPKKAPARVGSTHLPSLEQISNLRQSR